MPASQNLASELHKDGSIYVMDEPTTGLHMSDITHLVAIMDRLVDAGNSVIVIEHNLDRDPNADWIIDLGPEGGSKGGEASCLRERRWSWSKHKQSLTGRICGDRPDMALRPSLRVAGTPSARFTRKESQPETPPSKPPRRIGSNGTAVICRHAGWSRLPDKRSWDSPH